MWFSIIGYIALGFLICLTLMALCACMLSSRISREEEQAGARESARQAAESEVARAQAEVAAAQDEPRRWCGLSFCLRGECPDYDTCNEADRPQGSKPQRGGGRRG